MKRSEGARFNSLMLSALALLVMPLWSAESADARQLLERLGARTADERQDARAAFQNLPEEEREALAPRLVGLLEREGETAWFFQPRRRSC